MEKSIKIGEKEYKMKSSAFTQFAYKNETGRSLLQDLKSLINNQKKIKSKNFQLDSFDEVNELLLKMSYVMIKEADKNQVTDYDSFLMGIDSLYDDMDWIEEVIELGVTPISRQLSKIK